MFNTAIVTLGSKHGCSSLLFHTVRDPDRSVSSICKGMACRRAQMCKEHRLTWKKGCCSIVCRACKAIVRGCGWGCEQVQISRTRPGSFFPLILAIIEVPLVSQSNHAHVATAAHDLLLWLAVGHGLTSLQHLLPDDRLHLAHLGASGYHQIASSFRIH